jgi:hypothetical protein
MPAWLKPTYIVIAVLTVLLGVQSYRFYSTQVELAHEKLVAAQLAENTATAREAGFREGTRRQKEANDFVLKESGRIVQGLLADNESIRKKYNNTYALLKDLAATPKWQCLNEPLPEEILKEFR